MENITSTVATGRLSLMCAALQHRAGGLRFAATALAVQFAVTTVDPIPPPRKVLC